MPDLEHIALRLRKARLALDAIKDRAQLAKDGEAPPVGGGQPAASSTTDDVHVAGLLEIARRKKRVEALAQKSAELLAKYNPYHGPNGRFTGPGGATFVSTTNKRTTERMRTGQMSGGGSGGASGGGARPTSGSARNDEVGRSWRESGAEAHARHQRAYEEWDKKARMLIHPLIGGKPSVLPDGSLRVFFDGLKDASGNVQRGSYDARTNRWEADIGLKRQGSVEKLKEAVNLRIKAANDATKQRAAQAAPARSGVPNP